MASGSDFPDFCNFPDAAAAYWYANQDTQCSIPDVFVHEDVPLTQNAFNNHLLPAHGFFNAFPPETQNVNLPVQTTSNILGIRPQTAVTTPDNEFRSGSVTIGAGLPFLGLTTSPNVPLIPPQPAPLLFFPTTTFPPNWIKVPQGSYSHGRRQWNFERSEPIYFSMCGWPGINMGDALRKEFVGLNGKDDPVLQGSAGAISCRFLFPGYPAKSGSYQIHARDWTRRRSSIKRSKLAYEISRNLERYLNRMTRVTPDESTADFWRIGQGFMRIDNMFLVSLVPVSKGSFQPEIWVEEPSVLAHVRAN